MKIFTWFLFFLRHHEGVSPASRRHLVWSRSRTPNPWLGELSGSCWPEITPTHFPKYVEGEHEEELGPVVPVRGVGTRPACHVQDLDYQLTAPKSFLPAPRCLYMLGALKTAPFRTQDNCQVGFIPWTEFPFFLAPEMLCLSVIFILGSQLPGE